MNPWASKRKKRALELAEERGETADSLDIRKALLIRVKAGEITLDQAKAELERIKRDAPRHGKTTRAEVWSRG